MDALWDPLSDALIDGLRDTDQPKRPQVLDLPAATTDVRHWARLADTSERSQALSRADRHNVVETWRTSADSLGEESRLRLASPVARLSASLQKNGLQTVETATAADELLSEITSADVCISAWDDLVAAAKGLPGSLKQFEASCDAFVAFLEASDRDLGTFGLTRDLRSVLSGGARAVLDAKLQLGDQAPPKIGADLHEVLKDPALSLSVDERIELCHRLVSEPARTGENVVWLKYMFAALEGEVKVGCATFYGAAWLGALDLQELPGFPPELANEKQERENTLGWNSDPQWGTVYVRVDVGSSPIGSAATRAIDFSEALLNLWSERDRTWIGTDCYVHYIDGIWRTSHGSMEHAVAEGGDFRWPNDPTGDHLRENAAHLVSPTQGPSQELSALSEMMRLLSGRAWSSAGRSEVLSGVQAIEYARANVDSATESWDSFARQYLRNGWVFRGSHREVFPAALNLASQAVAEAGPVSEDSIPEVESIVSRLHQEYVGVGLEADPGELYKIAIRLGQLADRRWLESALLQRAIRAASTTKANAMINELEVDFDLLLNRLVRCRNCLTHGLQISDKAVETVRSFAISLGTSSTSMEATAILSGRDRREYFQERVEDSASRIAQIRSGQVEQAFSKNSSA